MLFFRTNPALLVAAFCFVSISTRYSASAQTTVDFETTTETSMTCAPNCYSDNVCADIVQVASEAASLEKALGIELRHQLHLLQTPGQSSPVCNTTKSEWREKSAGLTQTLGSSPGPSCSLKLPSDNAICAAFIKLSECAVSHLRITYSNQDYCLTETNHGGWLNVMEDVRSVISLLDNLYESEPSSHRKLEWEGIKSSISRLANYARHLSNRWGENQPPCRHMPCAPVTPPRFWSVWNPFAVHRNEQGVDETWLTVTLSTDSDSD